MLVLSILGVIILVVGGIFFFINYAKNGSKKMSYIIMIVGLLVAGSVWYQCLPDQARTNSPSQDQEK